MITLELTVLAFELFEALTLRWRARRALLCVFCQLTPTSQGLGCAADLRGNRIEGCPAGWIVFFKLENQPNSAFSDFRGIAFGCIHDSSLSR
jgi:hypothetical protein